MSEMSTSLDLTEFFNNDDSQGHGLAEFLQKRCGNGQRQKFLFMNCDFQSISLNVQLEKLSPSQQETNCTNNIETEKEHHGNEAIINSAEKQNNTQGDKTDGVLPLENNVGDSFEVSEDPDNLQFQPLSPISPERLQNPIATVSPTQPCGLMKPLSPLPLNQRLSSVRKSGGGVSTRDRLRRYSLKKQLSKHCGGRRTLLKEFESTIDDVNFLPSSWSTPLSPTQSNSPAKSSSINNSCCRNTEMLVKSLQRKNDDIEKCMNSILENTLKRKQKEKTESTSNETNTNDQTIKTPVKRTTKENIATEVILTPEKSASDQRVLRSVSLRLQTNHLSSKIKETQPQNYSSQRLSKSSTYLENNRSKSRSSAHQLRETLFPNLSAAGLELSNTPLERNVTIKPPAQNVDTQHIGENIVIKAPHSATVVVPVNLTFNTPCVKIAKTKHSDNLPTLSTEQTHLTGKTNDDQCNYLTKDNLKLSDILTEDEGDTPKAAALRTVENNSEIPLNLAPLSATKLRTKRLRKRSLLRRRFQMDNLHRIDTETEKDEAPQGHISKNMTKKKKILLNKAPGIPLNGEKFAQELTRMSNYEILDLRKRNSIGEIFVNACCRTRRYQEEAIRNQHLLDEQIQKELLRRNMNEIIATKVAQSDDANFDDVENISRPDNSLTQQQHIQNDSKESSLNGEKSADRVLFRSYKSKLSKEKNKDLTEVLQQYLRTPTTLLQKSCEYISKSKRSLHTHGDSQSEDNNSLMEILAKKQRNSKYKENSIPYVSSPPKSDGKLVTTLRVASPPPPLIFTRNSETEQHQQNETNQIDLNLQDSTSNLHDQVSFPPPPPGFDNDSVSISNETSDPFTSSNFQSENVTTNGTYLNKNAKNDEDIHIFKKPRQLTPKKSARKRKVVSISLDDITTNFQHLSTNSEVTTDNTLRRSKRGPVPFKKPPIMLLLQKSLIMKSHNVGKKSKEQKSKVNKKRSVRKSTRLTETGSNQNKHPALSEDVAVTNEEKQKKNKVSRTKRNKPKNCEETSPPSEHLIHTPPPVYHINNVFNELPDTISNLTTPPTTTMATLPPPLKTKPLRVRVARLKYFGCDSVNTVTSTSSNNSNSNLILWLKNIKQSDSSTGRNNEKFNLMRISSASSLSFTELQGVEYAFYDTDEKAFLGYLRFNPHQRKPKKKTRHFHLHFIVLAGNFRITIGDIDQQVGVGDMVAIEKFAYYDIENTSDDIGILMVIKK